MVRNFSEPQSPNTQPPSCDNHEFNQLNCVECTIIRHTFYGNTLDDDGDDDEIPNDPEMFDGGFGRDSYFYDQMKKG